jgi:CheY-like chemotaxis protein
MKKILIIDDDPRNIFALSAILKSRSFHCVPASGGQEALTILAEIPDFDIVLVDMMMPGMDGTEVIHCIRKQVQPDLPVISVTALAMVGDKEKCLQAGADAYISKPVDIDKLLDVINELLTKRPAN